MSTQGRVAPADTQTGPNDTLILADDKTHEDASRPTYSHTHTHTHTHIQCKPRDRIELVLGELIDSLDLF